MTVRSTEVMGRAASRCGGVAVEQLLGYSPPFPIADFWFEQHAVVAELKVMEQDLFSSKSFVQQTTALYRTWIDRGFDVPIVFGSMPIRTRDIPHDCAIELLGLLKSKIESAFLNKANKQIRSTKKELGRPDAYGLLLIGNDGSLGFHPALVANLLHHSLSGKFRSIEGVIYFTGDCKAVFPGVPRPTYYWSNMEVENRRTMSLEFQERLSAAWQVELSAATGEQVVAAQLPDDDPDFLDQVRLLRP